MFSLTRLPIVTFTTRRTFSGSLELRCDQTGDRFLAMPCGRETLVSVDGRYIGARDSEAEALGLIQAEARSSISARRRIGAVPLAPVELLRSGGVIA